MVHLVPKLKLLEHRSRSSGIISPDTELESSIGESGGTFQRVKIGAPSKPHDAILAPLE